MTQHVVDGLPKNHISYEAEASIRKMIKPLEKLGIQFFCYGEDFSDKTGFTLHTNAKYYESWFDNEGTVCTPYLQNGWYFPDNALPEEVLKAAHSQDLGNFLTYVEHRPDKSVVYEFALRPDFKNSKEFYKENIPFLKRFGRYFQDEIGRGFIEQAQQQRIKPFDWMMHERVIAKEDILCDLQPAESLPPLKDKEKLMLQYLLRGHSNKDISTTESISEKSVFQQLARLKKKWKCKSKSEVFEAAKLHNYVAYYFPQHVHDLHEEKEESLIASLMNNLFYPLSKLSQQEYKCCQLFVKGLTLAEISKQLGIEIPTVADYVNRMKSKINCQSKQAVFTLLLELGLMDINLS